MMTNEWLKEMEEWRKKLNSHCIKTKTRSEIPLSFIMVYSRIIIHASEHFNMNDDLLTLKKFFFTHFWPCLFKHCPDCFWKQIFMTCDFTNLTFICIVHNSTKGLSKIWQISFNLFRCDCISSFDWGHESEWENDSTVTMFNVIASIGHLVLWMRPLGQVYRGD